MKENLFPLFCFAGGIVSGAADVVPPVMHHPRLPMLLLCLLVFQVGVGLGRRCDWLPLVRSLHWSMLLLPLFTIGGTLLFSIAALPFCPGMGVGDVLAVGSGFGYYSLSSVLIVEMKGAAVGMEAATRLASVALLANVMREAFALFGCSAIARSGNGYAAISVAGINSMDVCLPQILGSGKEKALLPLSIYHGILLEVSVPLLLALFC